MRGGCRDKMYLINILTCNLLIALMSPKSTLRIVS